MRLVIFILGVTVGLVLAESAAPLRMVGALIVAVGFSAVAFYVRDRIRRRWFGVSAPEAARARR